MSDRDKDNPLMSKAQLAKLAPLVASQGQRLYDTAPCPDCRVSMWWDGEAFMPHRCDSVVEFPDGAEKPCDICKAEGRRALPFARYEGKTQDGSWALMCFDHFASHGVGLGVGVGEGQALVSTHFFNLYKNDD